MIAALILFGLLLILSPILWLAWMNGRINVEEREE